MVRSRGGGPGRSSRATHEIPANKKRKKVATSSPTPSVSSSEDEEAPSSPQPPPPPSRNFTFLPSRFRSKYKQQRFLDLESRQIIAERPVIEILPLIYLTDEYRRRNWTKIGEPEDKYNEIIIREFYANAFPVRPDSKDRISWVRGKTIAYDPEAINTFLQTEYTISEEDDYRKLMKTAMNEEMSNLVLETLSLLGSQYQTGTKNQPTHILRADLKSLMRLWQAVLYNNVVPLTHTSDITISKAKFIFCILLQKDVNIATLISNEIHAIVLSKPSKSGAVRPLAFPGLITGLCKAKRVVIPQPLVSIRRKIDHVFVNARCYNP
uniref:Putative plant transposon protein domain-containing protein n=1 Tax=Cajanus cajan TaxID=3821 RepID=A0A151U600_CAJCA|nr:hypothetical protein KK1_007426 [Cajanus cajan]